MSISIILGKVRDQIPLQKEEINEFSTGLADGAVSDAQVAAFAMAVCLNGLSERERVDLTLAMRDTGNVMNWDLPGPVIDKHSTGGIGDNVSLVLAPMLAACGAFVPMVSGRGLGHTGGTLDKLESIPGYRTQVSGEEFEHVVTDLGCAIVGAGEGIAPADKRLYAIRDLTGTVESVDLITSSILSKKLAAGLEALVLDVKVGSGAFMQNLEKATELARSLVSVANGAGCRSSAMLTDMNQSLASSAGNALEVKSALTILKNEPGEERLLEVTLALGSNLLVNTEIFSDEDTAKESLEESLHSGKGAEIFGRMITALGGPINFVEKPDEYLPVAENILDFPSPSSGYLKSVNGRILGQAVIELGGGRKEADDKLDLSVGLDQFLHIGKYVEQGDPLLRIHASNARDMEHAKNLLSEAFQFSENSVESNPLILESIT
ncbi:MAG: thymidine phosphorylase [Verrucomicrobiota bacterium]|nr:thymidine phosphorylase [Verrucomicrobiota bacterium]